MMSETEVFQDKLKLKTKITNFLFIPIYDAIFFETTVKEEKRDQLTQVSIRN